ncbi:BA71V-L60L [African swine fever virus]|uniref:BA71V-L60L n=1 Tax=African swine fever virus TaxID=10497 RepID=A0A0C5AZ93_ASF|nr:BA71V-L60L [African swine fever virus]AJL34010.1 BA71V-L60L [African swine fever virus]
MDDTLPKQMSSTDTPPLKEEQAHCNDKTSEKQPKNINDNKCTDEQNTDSQNVEPSEVYSMRLNNEWQLYVML